MRILLTGKNGQVGFELQRALAPLGELIAVDRSECDLESETSLREAIRRAEPDVIVNPAAYTAVDRAEGEAERAHAVNAHAPGIIGAEAARRRALVVHYSTDYVFDGTATGRYAEDAMTGPQGVYGQSKLAGEKALSVSGARYLVFRTSWVFGAHGANFAKTMLRLAAERDELKVVADQVGAPTSAALIADVTAHAIRQAVRDGDGAADDIYHLAAGGETNWHAYACYVIEAARRAGRPVRVAADAILPISTEDYPTPARRPANSRLDTAKLQQTFGLTLPHWQSGLDHVLQQIIRS
ncbi:dTDP-4-dehydrorhamnose reductase [Shinella zoogloeoides]|uniref:dTDP-4-dehydrorhamnose reductase n=1 Tax=Shinella zoogloeoides TaxID=352475 RepID=UPI00273EFE79|nr:dTDP-4-dehydrorhamnose reductase [Shinella zoogloeoides]WLR92970.1 dTDP-4-dehydrorhamnose reductase [Shinella zoogloeoides]